MGKMVGRRPVRAALVAAVLAAGLPTAAVADGTVRVSVGPHGVQGNNGSTTPSLSADGRRVAFESVAANLVVGDTNEASDVFVRNISAGITRRVSIGRAGTQANGSSFRPRLSADGSVVVFDSDASNLVAGDTNGEADVFVRDLRAGTTRRVSVGPKGAEADELSFDATVSADGRLVAFESFASNLVRGGTPRFTGNVYLRDLAARTTTLLSVGRHGEPANSDSTRATVSADGRFVAFASAASNLVAGDTNGAWDAFVHDRKRGTTERVSVGPGGAQGNGDSGVFGLALSGNGRRVAFVSEASNLVGGDRNGVADIFVRDLDAGTTRRVSVGPGGIEADSLSVFPSFSADGRYVAFDSIATNLVPHDRNGQTDVFVHDLETGTTTRASVAGHGAEGNATSAVSSLSANGHAVAFQSEADNLVPGDTNGQFDVFVRYR